MMMIVIVTDLRGAFLSSFPLSARCCEDEWCMYGVCKYEEACHWSYPDMII